MRRTFVQYSDRIIDLFNFSGEKRIASLTFQVTDSCNLACTYCYQINKAKHRMSFETAKAVVDLILDEAENPESELSYDKIAGIEVEYIGGEPFLEIDLIEQISDYFEEELLRRNSPWINFFVYSISSNGVLYFDERVQKYLRKRNGKVSLSISIDGNKSLHDACRLFPNGSGSYDIVEKAVKHFISTYDSYAGSKMTFAPENIRFASDALKNLIKLGYLYVSANCAYEEGWTLDDAKIFYHQLKDFADYFLSSDYCVNNVYCSLFSETDFKPMPESDNKNWCGGTGDMLAVDYRGYFYPCLRYMESSLGTDVKPVIIGDLEHGLFKAEEHKKCFDCLKCITRRTQTTDECFYCPIARGCGHCSAYNYQKFGTPNKKATFICDMHKARSLANVYYWNKYYQKYEIDKTFHMHLPKDDAVRIIGEKEYEMLLSLESGSK